MLIDNGARIGAALSDGVTALHVAAENGHALCIRVLLAAGADANVRDKEGWTPLRWARERGNRAAARTLVTAGGRL